MPSCSSAQVEFRRALISPTQSYRALRTFNARDVFRLVENGYVHKAVNYDGEMFVIEEIQAFENPVPINTLSLSASKVTNRLISWNGTERQRSGPSAGC